MGRKAKGTDSAKENEQIYRYWVEVLDLRDGTVHYLPLKEIVRIYLPRRKGESGRPGQHRLQMEDGPDVLEGADIDELAAQLRQKYPDGIYERRLKRERDIPAEQQRKHGMEALARLLMKCAIEKWVGQQGAES